MKTYNIAIIGAGPAGYFSAQALQNYANTETNFKIDLIERLSTPWGLVRNGVAPDHEKIKAVSEIFENISSNTSFRFFGNVQVGKDINLKSLVENYDVVILAVGSSQSKKLNIPGENLKNYFTAEQFVSWYNSHPDFKNLEINTNVEHAVIIGAGNVALDITRILLKDIDELKSTDISLDYVEKFDLRQLKAVMIKASF